MNLAERLKKCELAALKNYVNTFQSNTVYTEIIP